MVTSKFLLSKILFRSKFLAAAPLLLSVACVGQSKYDRLQTEYHSENQARRQLEDELQRRDGDMADVRSKLSEKETAFSQLEDEANQSKERIAQLEKALGEAQKQLEPISGAAEGIEVFKTPDGFAYRIADQLLFDPGSTDIREGGRKALAAIAQEINNKHYPDIRIDGHTDADPVVKTKSKYPMGNHQLAAERALAVYKVLVIDSGVPEEAVTLAAFGPNKPVAKEKTDAAKAKNRRVEIHVRVPKN